MNGRSQPNGQPDFARAHAEVTGEPSASTGPIPPTELGISPTPAVLLDATLVRMMVVPSLMKPLGRTQLVDPAGSTGTSRALPPPRFDKESRYSS